MADFSLDARKALWVTRTFKAATRESRKLTKTLLAETKPDD